MNSYNLLKDGHGYFGPEINDGEPNYNDDMFYNAQEIVQAYLDYFPYNKSYVIYKDNKEIIHKFIDGIQLETIKEFLDKTLLYSHNVIVPQDYELMKKQLFDVYERLMDFVDKTNLLEYDKDKQLQAFKQFLVTLGFNIVSLDDDIIEKMLNNIIGWYYG